MSNPTRKFETSVWLIAGISSLWGVPCALTPLVSLRGVSDFLPVELLQPVPSPYFGMQINGEHDERALKERADFPNQRLLAGEFLLGEAFDSWDLILE